MIYRHVSSYTDRHVSSYADRPSTTTALGDFYLAADLVLAYTAEPFEYPRSAGPPKCAW